MEASAGIRRATLGLATILVAVSGTGIAPAWAQQGQGRPQKEYRIPLRQDRNPGEPPAHGIRVVMVAPDEVNLPVVGAAPAPLFPGHVGGAEMPQTSADRAAGSGGSLFDQILGGDAAPAAPVRGTVGSEPAAAGPIDLYSRPSSDTAADGSAAVPAPPAYVDGDSRPAVRVIPSGTGRIIVLPAEGSPGAMTARSDADSRRSDTGMAPVNGASLAPTAGAAYRVGPGDVLDIFVWRNPELSRQIPVRPDGYISLPLVGEMVATGKTAEELQQELAARLEDYVQMPTVTVSVSQINSLIVYVLGNVNTPGPVTMDRNLTVLQAVAMAGGLNEFANRNDIVVLRTDTTGAQRRFPFRYGDVVKGTDLSSNMTLQAGDVIYVP